SLPLRWAGHRPFCPPRRIAAGRRGTVRRPRLSRSLRVAPRGTAAARTGRLGDPRPHWLPPRGRNADLLEQIAIDEELAGLPRSAPPNSRSVGSEAPSTALSESASCSASPTPA